jgi:hypothetical protein
MATKKKLLQAAAGSAGGAGGLNVEQVFSTYLYEGNGANNYIKNDLNIGDGAAENTVLHLTGDTLSDSSPFNHTMTAVGNTSVNTSTKKYGTGSIYFDGTGDYLRAEDSRFVLGSYDFTIEFWLNLPDASPTKGIFHIWDNTTLSNYSIALYHIGNDLTLQFKNGIDGTPNGSISTSTDVISNNTWHHIAAVRHNNTINLYVDGTAVSSGFDATGINLVMNYFELGTHWDSNYTFTGYIDDFRITRGTARYTSNFTAPTAALSLDTATTGEGGLVWIKQRNSTGAHLLWSTEYTGNLNSTNQDALNNASLTPSFNSNGFSIGPSSWSSLNASGSDYASWTFRKAPKFFDVVTYTGDGTSSQQITHNLGVTPGLIIVKAASSVGSNANWLVWHRSLTQSAGYLNSTQAFGGGEYTYSFNQPSDTYIDVKKVGSIASGTNDSGITYVAYLFAHNDGDGEFGPDGDADIIKCGSYTTDASADATINLGWEPQWVLFRPYDDTSNWKIVDNMRGFVATAVYPTYNQQLAADTSGAEAANDNIQITSTGFDHVSGFASKNFIYIAIRRGPMAVPTDATDVFNVQTYTGNGATNRKFTTGFPIDTNLILERDGGQGGMGSRLIDGMHMTSSTAVGYDTLTDWIDYDYNDGFELPNAYGQSNASDGSTYVTYSWQRRPNYFDVVAYTGNGTAGRTVSHNLGVAPEMMWVKRRDGASGNNGYVYHKDLTSAAYYLMLNDTAAENNFYNIWNSTAPTSSEFSLGNYIGVNYGSATYIAYLFASLDGVSKVGSYTGTGSTLNIDCGFSSGARFVLIKRTDSTSPWWLWDSERGIVAGNDPWLELNSNSMETTGYDWLDPYSSGFSIPSSGNNNASGATYIFYAIA